MKDFVFNVNTKILFGKKSVEKIGRELKDRGVKHVLFCYGGGSIKSNGLYDRIVSILKEEGIDFCELSGIKPNPRIESVREGVKISRENNVDFILAVGGGSTIDCAKAIAAGIHYEGDPWDLVINKATIKAATPIGAVLTLAATGSEMDPFSVITNPETKEKLGFSSELVLPVFAVMDPTVTYTLPQKQTMAGIADIMSHTMENYFSKEEDCFLQDKFAEGILKTCIKYARVLKEAPENYEARANVMWASSWAINGLISTGKATSWTVHPIEHELSAHYDITHGVGLALLTPAFLTHILSDKTVNKISEFAYNVFDIEPTEDKFKDAQKGIDALYNFFKEMDIPMSLRELSIDDSLFEEMAEHALGVSTIETKSYVSLTKEDIVEIYRKAL